MVGEAEKWPPPAHSTDWPTFAGGYGRNTVAPQRIDIGAAAWPAIAVGDPLAAEGASSRIYTLRRIAEGNQGLLSYHPLVVDGLLLLCDQTRISAFDLSKGTPAWKGDPKKPPGEIFSDDSPSASGSRIRSAGAPRFTMTVHGHCLFARMGSQVTSRPVEAFDSTPGYLVCVDLKAQGRLMWKVSPDDEKWAFEGCADRRWRGPVRWDAAQRRTAAGIRGML